MKKIWIGFRFLLLCTAFILVPIGAAGYLAWDTYTYWKHGVEKEARVLALDHVSGTSKGGSNYYYRIEIDGRRSMQPFRMELPVGESIPVLVLPGDPDSLTPGSRRSSPLDLFSYSMGGRSLALLTLGVLALLILASPYTLRNLIRYARKLMADAQGGGLR